jgi:hypothetical protein
LYLGETIALLVRRHQDDGAPDRLAQSHRREMPER